jgi:2-methylisocitrate lyase-like PEP mutase family enzyme
MKDTKKKRLRELLRRPGIIRSMGAHDVLTAVLMEKAGFEMAFIGGFGTSASLYGLPDLNFLGMTEMAEAVRRMAGRISVPLVADGDTGHGDLHNVMRCVREFENAGAAGMILEDQIFPKRCGHFEGKQVIPRDEMVLKLKAAVEARIDPDFVLVARTDAREPAGIDDAIDRVNAYCEAGADVAFVEAPVSVEELELVARRVPYPKLVNMLSFGRTPILPAGDLEKMGYKIVVAPIESILLAAKVIQELAETFRRDGHTKALAGKMMPLNEIKKILGVDEFLSLRENLSK